MKRLAILGSTGSIGRSTLSLVDLYPDRFQVVALAARQQADLLFEQAQKYRPRVVALEDDQGAAYLREQLPGVRVVGGPEGVIEVATEKSAEMVVAGITGGAGLLPTYHAILENKDIALANKETLVMAGELIMSEVVARRTRLLPVDSEHGALHQCLGEASKKEVRRLLLTASGGPFFRKSREELETVSVEETLNHPTWEMGPKITVDSATLMNKGLEVIEAHHLFGLSADRISIVVHPQSTIHSMVEFIDGTMLAQMSITDMRLAIVYALSYPERWDSALPFLDLFSVKSLEFFPPDADKFPCLRLAREALELGQTYPAVLNAANEVAVDSFLRREIPFSAIAGIVEETLGRHRPGSALDLDAVLAEDQEARRSAAEAVHSLAAS